MELKEVSENYLAKIRFAIRRNANKNVDSELTDIILQCRMDMIKKGVPKETAENEQDPLVLGCQRAFARWQFGISGDDAERNHEDYMIMLDELRKNGGV